MKKIYFYMIFNLFLCGLSFAQEIINLDIAIENSAEYFTERLPKGSTVVILNIQTEHSVLAEYVIEELTMHLVNSGHLTIVDRFNLEILRQEMNFQLSGEVSDSSAQQIGQLLGAQTIISGAITPFSDFYRLRIRAIAVESATIQGVQNTNIAFDNTMAALTGSSTRKPSQSKTSRPTSSDQSFNNWLSIEASILGGGLRYDRMLTSKVSLGINGYFSFFFLIYWWDVAADISVRFYPLGKTFFVGMGLGFHLQVDSYYLQSDRWQNLTGGALTPEIGWKIKIGEGRVFIQPGVKVPLTFGEGNTRYDLEDGDYDYYNNSHNFGFSVVPYVGFGIAF